MERSEETVSIVEVGARDGLQNLASTLCVSNRVELIQRLAQAGLNRIEAGAFVSPKWVPQMADTDLVLQNLNDLHKAKPALLSVLTPNMQGLEAALKFNIKEIAVFTAASESFNKYNTNASIAESLKRFEPLCKLALSKGVQVRGYVSCAIHCPYEGFISPEKVLQTAQALIQLGCYEVSLGDTTGRATPGQIRTLLQLLQQHLAVETLAGHFHDTYGQGLANVLAALDQGVRTFDASIAGLGGCPYSPGASGNLATEDLVYLLHGLGFNTGVNLTALTQTGAWISKLLGQVYGSKTGLAMTSALARTKN